MYDPNIFADYKKEHSYEIENPQELLKLLKPMSFCGMKIISVDTETYNTSLENHSIPSSMVRRWVGKGNKSKPQDFPFCISFYDGANAYSIFDTLENGFKKFQKLKIIFEDASITKILHNAKYDMHMLENIGIKFSGTIMDTVVLAKLVNENRKSFRLRDLVKDYGVLLFEEMVDDFKSKNKIKSYKDIPKELITQYANADVINCFDLFVKEYPSIAENDLTKLFKTECDLVYSLYAMERAGMLVDKSYEKELKESLKNLISEAEGKIYTLAGYRFNINSTSQIHQALLATGADAEWFSLTDKGNVCLNGKAIEKLIKQHDIELLNYIDSYRKNTKLLNTYAMGIYAQLDSSNRVHGSINQTEAVTGRMSIVKPALQTLPKKDKRIRKAFLPTQGSTLYMLDLDQVEYRLFAHYANAKGLIEAIKEGHDVHKATAALIYSVAYEEVMDDQREKAKTMNFALIYGMGNNALAESLGLSLGEAENFKTKYFMEIPEALPFINSVKEFTHKYGYVKNVYGRRRYLNNRELYKAPNALIQGCAADYLKKKIVLVHKWLIENKHKTKIINVVHDEIILDVPNGEDYLVPEIRDLLSDYTSFRVPITAGVDKGMPSWGEKEEVTYV